MGSPQLLRIAYFSYLSRISTTSDQEEIPACMNRPLFYLALSLIANMLLIRTLEHRSLLTHHEHSMQRAGENRQVSRSLTEDEGPGQGSQAEPGSPTDLGSGRVTPYILAAGQRMRS